MINTLNADSNVGGVHIRLSSYYKWNDKILTTMIKRYSNLYAIGVFDGNE